MSHRRLGRGSRCIGCRMRVDLCLCSEITALVARTRFVIVMHAKEANKPTNTGFLVRAMLPSTEIRLRGIKGGPRLDLRDLSDAGVLFPLSDAIEIDVSNAPPILIVPDGTWPQARAALRRDMMSLPCFKLPLGLPRECSLRSHHDPRSLSTLEAITRVLSIVGDHSTSEEIMRVFRVMVERTMMTRAGAAIRFLNPN